MMFNAKRNKTDLIVTKKLPHTTAAVEAVSKLVCKIAEAAEGKGNETVHSAMALADITKRLAEAEKIVSFTEVIRYDGGPLGKSVFLEEEKKGEGDR